MRTMRAAMAGMLLCLGSAAMAQRVGPVAPAPLNGGIASDLRDNRARIDRERDGGRLTRGDARRARDENAKIGELADRYGADGRLSNDERTEIDNRNAAMRSILDAPARRRTPR